MSRNSNGNQSRYGPTRFHRYAKPCAHFAPPASFDTAVFGYGKA